MHPATASACAQDIPRPTESRRAAQSPNSLPPLASSCRPRCHPTVTSAARTPTLLGSCHDPLPLRVGVGDPPHRRLGKVLGKPERDRAPATAHIEDTQRPVGHSGPFCIPAPTHMRIVRPCTAKSQMHALRPRGSCDENTKRHSRQQRRVCHMQVWLTARACGPPLHPVACSHRRRQYLGDTTPRSTWRSYPGPAHRIAQALRSAARWHRRC